MLLPDEEILEDLDDEGRQVDADNLSRALIYKDHPLGFTITGDAESVRSFDEKLPYSEKDSDVIERRVKKLGEISDLKPGASGTLTLPLRPGNYVLLCNQPGHYRQGMWTKLIVSP